MVKSVKDVKKIGNTVQIMEIMGMNRKERRAIGRANNGVKIGGSNKPHVVHK